MATQTRIFATHGDFGDGSPIVTFSYDYDDATLFLTMLRCDNRSGQLAPTHSLFNARAWGRAELSNGTRQRQAFFDANAPGEPTEFAIPTGAAARLQLVLRPPKNSLDGVSFSTVFPA